MTKIICNHEALMPKKSANAKLFMAIIVGSALLPLSALAVTEDSSAANVSPEKATPKPAPISEDKIRASDKEPLKPNGAMSASSAGTATTSQSNTSNNNAPAAPLPSDKADNLNSTNTVEKPVATSPKKMPFWKNTDYLLVGGALLLILGGALLIIRKISALNAENRELSQKIRMLNSYLNNATDKLKQSNAENVTLKTELNNQRTMHDEQNNTMHNTFGTALPIIDSLDETPIIEDLNAADRKQLSESITKWFTTNRGNTKVYDLVPVDIKRKLEHLHYTIELWTGSDGVDSVELTQHTMRASVISLTKPDRQGFSYCYKKPNALSTVWVNKAWYQVQRTDRTLEVLGAPLEIN